MKRIIYSLIIGAAFVTQTYAEEEVTTPAQDAPAIEKKCDKPQFKKCEKCIELRKKAREERMAKRKARMEELKNKKEEGKADFKKEKKEWKGPIFCDECKEKFKDIKPEEWHKNWKNKKGQKFKDGEGKCCKHCRKGKGKGKFAPKKDNTPPPEAPTEVE